MDIDEDEINEVDNFEIANVQDMNVDPIIVDEDENFVQEVIGPITIQQHLQRNLNAAIDEAIELVACDTELNKLNLLIMFEEPIKRIKETFVVRPIEDVIAEINQMPQNASIPLPNTTGHCIMGEPKVITNDEDGNIVHVSLAQASEAGHNASIVIPQFDIDPIASSEFLFIFFNE